MLFLSNCKSVYGPEDELNDISALLKSNEVQRTAHLTGNAELLAGEIADTMINVSRGHVYKSSNKEIYNRFNNYFKNVEYIKWDDVEDPIIQISNDGTFAGMILKKIILAKHKNTSGEREKGATLFSWSALHKKINGKWKITSNTSTREELEFSSYDEYYYKGKTAFDEQRYEDYLHNIERAYYLAHDNVSVQYEFAKALTINNDHKQALKILDRLADIRYYQLGNIENDTMFTNLRNSSEYKALTQKIYANMRSVNNSKSAFTIKEKDLVPEGIAIDNNTGTLYLSSSYKRKIISIDKNGNINDFKSEAEDGLWSTWGMEVDEERNHLWVISSNTTAGILTRKTDHMNNGKCRVYKYDTVTGELIKIYSYDNKNENHFFNDLTISKTGNVYITESLTSKVFWIPKELDELELFYQSDPMFKFLNGLAVDNDEAKLFVANSDGICVLDLATNNFQLIQMPKDVSLEGIDGLTFYNNTLIAQQSGYPNNSIIQYALDKTKYFVTSYRILEANNPYFDSATTGEVGQGYYYYIANSQVSSAFVWNKNGPEKIKPYDELKEIQILKIEL